MDILHYPPYHVFFYLPVIILLRKRERLDLTVEVRGLRLYRGTSYIVSETAPYTLKQHAKNELATLSSNPHAWEQTVVDTGRGRYRVYHRGDGKLREASQRLLHAVERGYDLQSSGEWGQVRGPCFLRA